MTRISSRIHSHPKMEEDKKVDSNHVIIDKELYFELVQFTSGRLPVKK